LKVSPFARVDANPGVLALGADFFHSPRAVFPKCRMNTPRVCKMILGDRQLEPGITQNAPQQERWILLPSLLSLPPVSAHRIKDKLPLGLHMEK